MTSTSSMGAKNLGGIPGSDVLLRPGFHLTNSSVMGALSDVSGVGVGVFRPVGGLPTPGTTKEVWLKTRAS